MKNRSTGGHALAALLFTTAFVAIAAAPLPAITGNAQAQMTRVEYNGNWEEGRREHNWHERERYRRYYRQPDIYYSAPPVYYPPPDYYAPRGPSLNLTFPLFR